MKVSVLTDVKIVCEAPLWWGWRYYMDNAAERMKKYAEFCESWVFEFDKFMRDHRSQDLINLSVERVYNDLCSFCGNVYEEDEDGPLCCSQAVDEWNNTEKRMRED